MERLPFETTGLPLVVRRRGPRAAHALVAATCLSVACGQSPASAPPARSARDEAAARRPRPFVPPYSYEHFVLAELLAARGRFADAAEAYRIALSGGDEDPYLLARLADVLDLSGDRAQAEHVLDRALELDPAADEAWMTRGRIAERRGEPTGALAAFERAESAAPTASAPVLAQARVLRGGGHVERAVAVLERYARREHVGAHHAARARLELALARDDGAALATAVDALLALSPPEQASLLRAAAQLLDRGHAASAVRVLAKLRPGPERDELYLAALLAAGDFARAELLLIETSDERLRSPERRARVQLAMGQPERALEALQTATGEPTPERLALRAEALAAAGRADQAAAVYATIPPKSKHFREATGGIAEALENAGRPALATEVRGAADAEAVR